MKKAITWLLVSVILSALPIAALCEGGLSTLNASGTLNRAVSVDPTGRSDGFSAVLYDNTNGLPTSEANAIAETGDGFIWIGSYAGLIRYDGTAFERMDSTTGIASVVSLFVDSADRLWIGTNDSGVAVMERSGFRMWGKAEGLKSASVRAIAEDEAGTVYVATTDGIAAIDRDMNLRGIDDPRISNAYISDLRLGPEGVLYGLTQDGCIFSMKDGVIEDYLDSETIRVKGAISFLPDPAHPGNLYVGTESSQVCYGSLERNFGAMDIKDIAPLTYVERFEYIDGQIWICAGDGIGVIDGQGFHLLKNLPMNNSIRRMLVDYEGNLWFVSTRQGVMKIVPNQFSDLYARYDIPDAVVNSTCMYGERLFVGTDSGLTVIGPSGIVDSLPLTKAVTAKGEKLDATDLVEWLDGCRIRSIIRDSSGKIWIATWRKYGLLRYDRGEVTAFTQADGLFSDHVRVVSERRDGGILVANTGGVSVIQGDAVVESYGEDAGIINTEILTVVEAANGDIIIGSDGGGIYIVGAAGTRHIGTEEGLTSEVVMRVKRDAAREIYWIVTSNSIAYMDADYNVTTVRRFPYSNNFDLYENSRGDIWVLSSNGIYVVPVEELLANGEINPVYYSIASGLPYIATSNAFSELTDDGSLYIAGVKGVVRVNIDRAFEHIGKPKIILPYIDVDGQRVFPDDSGNYTLQSGVKKVTIYPYVLSNALDDIFVSFRLEGFDSAETTVNRSELIPLTYTNLNAGTYRFVISAVDSAGGDRVTASCRIVREKALTEGRYGTIIMDVASLFLLAGILAHSAPYRRRGQINDRLSFAMLIVNAALAVVELACCLLEKSAFPFARELMVAGYTAFYAMLEAFPYLMLLYVEFISHRDKEQFRRTQLIYGIPCLLFLLLLLVNLTTGWIFSIAENGAYASGPINPAAYVPLLFYFVAVLIRVSRIDWRLVLIGVLLVGTRIVWDAWYPGISSISFVYALFLLSIYLFVIDRTLTGEAVVQ